MKGLKIPVPGPIKVHLVDHHQLGFTNHGRAIGMHFVYKGMIVFQHIGFGLVGDIQDVHEKGGPFNMFEESMAQPPALTGAFNKAWYIRQHQGGIIISHNPQVGHKGGKWVVVHFGVRGGQASQQGGFARIGQSDQADIGQKFQNKPNALFFPGKTGFGDSGRPVGGGGIMLVPPAALSAGKEGDFLMVAGQISQDLARIHIFDKGAHGHL